MDGSIRRNRTAEQLETVGLHLAYAICRTMLGNGIIGRNATPRAAREAVLAYAALG